MTEPSSPRLLVVANRTESAPRLLEEVKHRAHAGCQIALMVPPERHPDAPDWTPEDALSLTQRAAGGQPVTLVDCGGDAAATIGELVESRRIRRDPAVHAARAPRALAPPHASQADPGPRHPGDRDPARPIGLVVLPRFPVGLDAGSRGSARRRRGSRGLRSHPGNAIVGRDGSPAGTSMCADRACAAAGVRVGAGARGAAVARLGVAERRLPRIRGPGRRDRRRRQLGRRLARTRTAWARPTGPAVGRGRPT